MFNAHLQHNVLHTQCVLHTIEYSTATILCTVEKCTLHCAVQWGHYCTAMNWTDHHLAQSRPSQAANLAEENIIWQQIVIVHRPFAREQKYQLVSQPLPLP